MGNIEIKNIVVSQVLTNCMLIINKTTREALVIDPGYEAQRIAEAITKAECKPAAILLTHGHFDHVMAVDEVRDEYNIPVYLYEDEEELLGNSILNHSAKYGMPYQTKADELVTDNQKLCLAGINIEVIHTAGHTSGCCCYYLPDEAVLISGDTLFYGTVGRTDFETSSSAAMSASVKRLLTTLPEDVQVFPGHGDTTTIGHEKRYNPFA